MGKSVCILTYNNLLLQNIFESILHSFKCDSLVLRLDAHSSILTVSTFYHGLRHTNESLIFKSVNILCCSNCYGLRHFFMGPCQWGNRIFLWIVDFSCEYTFVNVLVDNVKPNLYASGRHPDMN